MISKIPILHQCSLAGEDQGEVLVERLSTYLARNHNLVFPHRHLFFQAVLFTKGGGSHHIDFEQYNIRPWHFYFMSPNQIHTWDFEGEMEGYVINFDDTAFKANDSRISNTKSIFLQHTLTPTVLEIEDNLKSLVIELFEQVLLFYYEKSFVKTSVLYFFQLIELHQLRGREFDVLRYNDTILANFGSLLEENFKELRYPKEYAELLYITPHHLNALCKKKLGYSAGEFIRKRVALEAKRLLAIEEIAISQIADELNFSDNSYFTKFFKKSENLTPEDFRKKISQLK